MGCPWGAELSFEEAERKALSLQCLAQVSSPPKASSRQRPILRASVLPNSSSIRTLRCMKEPNSPLGDRNLRPNETSNSSLGP